MKIQQIEGKMVYSLSITFTLLLSAVIVNTETSCSTMTIGPNNINKINDMIKCDVIEGSVSLIRIKFDKWNKSLSTNIREITGYLLVYQVDGLQSLEQIFPKLSVIRGFELFGRYSLILYENSGLLSIGLKSLVNILNGSVRIENNPVLCFVDTVNWIKILSDMKSQHYVLKRNKNSTECPTCPEVSTNSPTFIPCWNQNNTQKICPDHCEGNACNSNGECCNHMCLADCKDTETRFCNICRYFKDHNNECVETCNQYLKPIVEFNQRKCIPKDKCSFLKFVTYNGTCVENCPKGYYDRNSNCDLCDKDFCKKTCNGGILIRTVKDLKKIQGCTRINGSLTIELKEQKTKIIQELENSLSDLRFIEGYLKILKSPQIVTLYFFKSLQAIEGKELLDGKYSLYVIENYHLEKLWMKNQTVKILAGKIFFHFNPKLCYEIIEALRPNIINEDTFSSLDVSNHTNGARVVCEPHITNLSVTLEDKNSTAVRIKIDPISFDDKRLHLGYFFYYIEASHQNVSMYDNRHGCGHDDWKLDIDISKNVRHIIKNLKPYTQYAYFVKTFTIATEHIKQDAFSEVQYFQTLPDISGPVRRFYSYPKNESAIVLHWWPPSRPKGKVKKYIINYKAQIPASQKPTEEKQPFNIDLKTNHHDDDVHMIFKSLDNKTYFRPSKLHKFKVEGKKNRNDDNGTCTCDGIENKNQMRGPAPEEDDFYDHESITFEDSLTDFLFIPVYIKHVRPKTNQTNPINITHTTPPSNTTTTVVINVNVTTNANVTLDQNNLNTTNSALNSNLNITIFNTTTNIPLIDSTNNKTANSKLNFLFNGTSLDKLIDERLKLYNLEKKKSDIDTDSKDFQIIKSNDKCESENLEDCWKNYGGIMIDGNIHKMILNNLHPSTSYNISIRVCNENVVKCSNLTIIEGRTTDSRIST